MNLPFSLTGPLSFVSLLLLSNVFMTFAWYAHLRHLSEKPWWLAVLFSWGIAFLEHLLQVPGNRIGFSHFSLAQLKIMREVITLAIFIPFAVFYMDQSFRWDFVWAGFCLLAAVYFIFAPDSARHRREFPEPFARRGLPGCFREVKLHM
jgi:uncharacterized protein (DUF486 family)